MSTPRVLLEVVVWVAAATVLGPVIAVVGAARGTAIVLAAGFLIVALAEMAIRNARIPV